MRRLQLCWTRWIDGISPLQLGTATIHERERLRKARLLSVKATLTFLQCFLPWLLFLHAHIFSLELGIGLLLLSTIVAGYLNRLGRCYLAISIFLAGWFSSAFIGGAFGPANLRLIVLVILSVVIIDSAFLLRWWLSPVAALFVIGATGLWLLSLQPRFFPMLALPQEDGLTILILLSIYSGYALIGSLFAQSTEQAVIRADRAEELAQAHEALQALHEEVSTQNEQLSSTNALLAALATTDPLTALPNHRALTDMLDHEIESGRRYHHVFALLFLDIDHFKALNDTYGHAGGDEVLREFATTVQQSLRQVDMVGRWGGEEFLVILTNMDGVQAVEAAERVRAAVAARVFAVGSGLHLTCSIGAAVFPSDGQDREALVAAADQAMYVAKQQGRNQVRSKSDAFIPIQAMGELPLLAATTVPGMAQPARFTLIA